MGEIIIDKVINNNIISAFEESGTEVVVMGRGIGFKKRPGQIVPGEQVEKIFRMKSKTLAEQLKELLADMPLERVEISAEIIAYAKDQLKLKLNQSIYVTLTDHINFAIERVSQGIEPENALLWEIKRFYSHEFQLGTYALQLIHERLGIKLPEDEAGFIALHFVNAGYRETTMKSITSTKIIKDILNIIKYNFAIELDEDDLNYDRLLTHLKYFAKRIVNNNQNNSTDSDFIKMISTTYPEAYECAVKIGDYILKNNDYHVNDDEIVYLTMHIQRVITVARENNINMDK